LSNVLGRQADSAQASRHDARLTGIRAIGLVRRARARLF
jgi:hypothetical protein